MTAAEGPRDACPSETVHSYQCNELPVVISNKNSSGDGKPSEHSGRPL